MQEDGESKGLIELSFEDARRLKWERGRAEHGPVMVKDPLLEAQEELLDLANYISILARDGQLTPTERSYMFGVFNAVKSYTIYLQQIYRRDPARIYNPTEYPYN